jgi:hypothetical protein
MRNEIELLHDIVQLLHIICNKLGIDPEDYITECVHKWEKDMSAEPDAQYYHRICMKCGQKETEYMGGSCCI